MIKLGTRTFCASNKTIYWAAVLVQLVKWSLPILEVPGSNPVIGKFYIEHLFPVHCIENTTIKKQRP